MKAKIAILALATQMICLSGPLTWAGSPEVTIGAGQFPVTIGIKGALYSSVVRSVPVTISFAPPWDLTSGPKETVIPTGWVDKSQAYNGGQYPQATVALLTSYGNGKRYMFFKKTRLGLILYGHSEPTGGTNFRLVPPTRSFTFPMKVGSTTSQRTSAVASDGSAIPILFTTKVVGKGIVIVGAGTFNDSVMVQTKMETSGSQPFSYIFYDWIAPYVGLVAEIQSLRNETDEHFTTAQNFQWLKSLDLP